jgi:hypothetical protein
MAGKAARAGLGPARVLCIYPLHRYNRSIDLL